MLTNVSRPPSLASAATNEIRDIKPPVAIPSGWAWVWPALAALAVAALLYLAWRYWQKRRAFVPPAIIIPPHVRARQKLQAALALILQPEPFCVAVSSAIRIYLEERFEFRAPERTTEEFLYELKATHLLTGLQKESLGDFLTSCDLVKFAKYQPGEPELRALHDSALRLVGETEPSTPATPAGQSASHPPEAAIA